jgi:hypothetical protein
MDSNFKEVGQDVDQEIHIKEVDQDIIEPHVAAALEVACIHLS